MIGVIVLLQIQQINIWFFDLVYRLYAPHPAPIESSRPPGMRFFRFWHKQPL